MTKIEQLEEQIKLQTETIILITKQLDDIVELLCNDLQKESIGDLTPDDLDTNEFQYDENIALDWENAVDQIQTH
jgi:hypothetical protein